jgi:hypothetical protein
MKMINIDSFKSFNTAIDFYKSEMRFIKFSSEEFVNWKNSIIVSKNELITLFTKLSNSLDNFVSGL